MSAVEVAHVRRMKGNGEEGEEDKCSWLKEACEREGRTCRLHGLLNCQCYLC